MNRVKEYLVDALVDSNGDKVSIRKIFRDKDFMENSGFYRIAKDGKMEPVSMGTVSYHIQQLGITEIELYRHHTEVTGKITCDFDDFTRKNNRNTKNIKRVYYENYSIENLVEVYNKLCELKGRNDVMYPFYPLEDVVMNFEVLFMIKYMENEREFSKDFYRVMGRVKNSGR